MAPGSVCRRWRQRPQTAGGEKVERQAVRTIAGQHLRQAGEVLDFAGVGVFGGGLPQPLSDA